MEGASSTPHREAKSHFTYGIEVALRWSEEKKLFFLHYLGDRPRLCSTNSFLISKKQSINDCFLFFKQDKIYWTKRVDSRIFE